jgi:hypothetical protein
LTVSAVTGALLTFFFSSAPIVVLYVSH